MGVYDTFHKKKQVLLPRIENINVKRGNNYEQPA
jgi:hypothetical protein